MVLVEFLLHLLPLVLPLPRSRFESAVEVASAGYYAYDA